MGLIRILFLFIISLLPVMLVMSALRLLLLDDFLYLLLVFLCLSQSVFLPPSSSPLLCFACLHTGAPFLCRRELLLWLCRCSRMKSLHSIHMDSAAHGGC